MARMISAWLVAIAALIAGCAALGDAPPQPAHPVEGVRKVVDSLTAEIRKRVETEPFHKLPVVVRTTSAGSTIEPIIADLVRTRLVDAGVAVEAVCGARCTEISLQEFAVDTARPTGLSAGQILTVAGGSVPFVGGLIRTLGEQQREQERAANRATGVFVTFGAREGNRYTARAHVIAILSAGDVALERQ